MGISTSSRKDQLSVLEKRLNDSITAVAVARHRRLGASRTSCGSSRACRQPQPIRKPGSSTPGTFTRCRSVHLEHGRLSDPHVDAERYELYYEAPDVDVIDGDGEEHGRRSARDEAAASRDDAARSRGVAASAARSRGAARGESARARAPQGHGLRRRAHRRAATAVAPAQGDRRLRARFRPTCPKTRRWRSSARTLKKDADHHFKWIWIDLALLILVARRSCWCLVPTCPASISRSRSSATSSRMRGAKHGLSDARWTFKQNAALDRAARAARRHRRRIACAASTSSPRGCASSIWRRSSRRWPRRPRDILDR